MRVGAISSVAGGVLGGVNSLSNVLGSPYSPHSLSSSGVFVLELLAALLGTTWAWALTAFGAAWWSGSIRTGPVVGVASLLVADVTYYLSDSLSGYADFSGIEVLFWALLAVPVGLLMGLLGGLAAQPRWWSIVPALAGPATVVLMAGRTGSNRIQPWPTVATWAIAAALTVTLLGMWFVSLARQRSARKQGLGLLRLVNEPTRSTHHVAIVSTEDHTESNQ